MIIKKIMITQLDYRGEWLLKLKAIPVKVITQVGYGTSDRKQPKMLYSAFPYKVGDRVAQMWIEKVEPFEFVESTSLTESNRGTGGFGSTGT